MSLRLGALVSGSGTTLQNLVDRIEAGRLAAQVVVVVSSSRQAVALERARRHGIPSQVVDGHGLCPAERGRRVFEIFRHYQVQLVVMAGFLKLVTIPEDFEGRVMNIHPALIPAFAGEGFYGPRVHQAVLDRGVKVTGCTVHFADHHYDHGPIILQRVVPVRDDDTPERLAQRVFEAECEAYPQAIRLFSEGRLSIEGSRVRIREG